MELKRLVGVILGVGGAVVTVGHLVWMFVADDREPYHGFLTWVMTGIVMVAAGLALMGTGRRGGP